FRSSTQGVASPTTSCAVAGSAVTEPSAIASILTKPVRGPTKLLPAIACGAIDCGSADHDSVDCDPADSNPADWNSAGCEAGDCGASGARLPVPILTYRSAVRAVVLLLRATS